jgi:RND family efflux transporter MFP subunit
MFSIRFVWRASLVLAVLAIVLATARSSLLEFRDMTAPDGPILWQVERTAFFHEVVEKGELESGDNVEVRCEVKSQGIRRQKSRGRVGRGGGARNASDQAEPRDDGGQFMILEIVPEGTSVQKGDVLAGLDSSGLKEELTDQQITCTLAEASVVKAKNDLESAQIALDEYNEGICFERRQTLGNRVITQTEILRQAQRTLRLTQDLSRQGFTTSLQVEVDRYAAEEAQVGLKLAQTELNCLETYTRPRTVVELQSAINVAEARYQTEQSNYELALAKLQELKEQIKKCEIRAPLAGKVVYANKVGMNIRGPQIIIEPGAMVRDGQTIVRLPNPESMQVKVLIEEENLTLVCRGQPARFTMDALPGIELIGHVSRVNDYPEPALDPRWSAGTREFEATVTIHDPTEDLRPGMSVEVRICVNHIDDQLQVPKTALVRRGSDRYCLLRRGSSLEAAKVKVGPSNGKFTVIEEGLEEDDLVVLGADVYLERIGSTLLPAKPKPSDSLPSQD